MRVPAGYRIGAATHTGLVRSCNEDDYLIAADRSPGLVAAVADGLGSIAGGAEASRTALRAAAIELLGRGAESADEQAMAMAFARAGDRVAELARETPQLREMGTTLTVMVFANARGVLGHIGDSRAYLLRRGSLARLTEDHAISGRQNILTRCIGAGRQCETPDVGIIEIEDGDRIAICSDGIWGMLDERAMGEILRERSPQNAARALVGAALAAGGPDNATAVVIDRDHGASSHVAELPEGEEGGEVLRFRVPPLRGHRGAALLAAISLVVIALTFLRFAEGPDPLGWLWSLLAGQR
ncbi:MAG: hypothetical protein Fur0037_16750 [Planctomycetota bacterium]